MPVAEVSIVERTTTNVHWPGDMAVGHYLLSRHLQVRQDAVPDLDSSPTSRSRRDI
jgi:hypothetical protein